MTGRLAGKVALVTAAGQGIGRATAVAFAREGAHVIATNRTASRLAGLEDQGIARTCGLDVCDGPAIDALARDIGPVDVLFNCAGTVHAGTALECTEEEWDEAFDLNVKSMFRTIRAFLPGMVEKGAGSIINVGSVISTMKGVPSRYAYHASKAAVLGMTKSIAFDFVSKGIRCNALCPGTVHSEGWEERVAALAPQMGGIEKAKASFLARQPSGRIGTVDEVAALAVYLAGDESAYMTGAFLPLDGGSSL